jgi:phospholipase C
MLMTIFGAHLNYRPMRIEGDDIVFDHIAPLEPDPKPTPGYRGVIGRTFIDLGPNAITFHPPLLGDTWSAENLKKVDHIVVVMMENRSYDHVLGYRAQAPFNDGAEGLAAKVIDAVAAAENGPFAAKRLRDAGFAKNDAGLMTRLPKSVGHELSDVAEQLSARATLPGGGSINSPKGFVANFKPRLAGNPEGVTPDDVLGFYDDKDLVFYAYLAEHYSYCDNYYCSHPGPTLPNRMFSLTGDLQHDRYGFPIPDSNNGDNFLLSREPTIYDLLTRKGLSFRVYESFPSVTMLRMFARYATDTVNIVPFDRLAADVARGDLPAFTAIEPQMHAHPEDDDHPDADMLRGQIFVKRVYDTLRSNPALWEKTLLIITYDEHGGFYDHVVPPVADLLTPGGGVINPGTLGGVVSPAVGGGVIKPVVGATVAAATPAGAAGGLAGGGAGVIGGAQIRPIGVLPAVQLQPLSLPIPYGVRVPTFVVSPWTVRGKGPSLVLDHCSILKTVLARFLGAEKPFFRDRVNASLSFDNFLTGAAPRMDVPPSPSLPPLPIGDRKALSPTSRITTPPLSRKDLRERQADYHDLSGRWARQLGR